MTKDKKICLIDTFRETIFEKNEQAFFSTHECPDTFEIERFLLKDILHLLNQYEREVIKNGIQ
jgi:hypothetical protein